MEPDRNAPAPVPEPAPVQPAVAPPPLQYDARPVGISRRQMNLFLLLLFVNTLIFAGLVFMPSASPWIKGMWESYQNERQRKKEEAALRAVVNTCMNYSAPADQLVYAESAADAAKLLADAGRAHTVKDLAGGTSGGSRGGGGGGLFGGGNAVQDQAIEQLTASGWHVPALRGWTESAEQLIRKTSKTWPNEVLREMSLGINRDRVQESVVFLHRLKTPAGRERLVWVFLNVEQDLHTRTDEPEEAVWEVVTTRRLGAWVFDPQNLENRTLTFMNFVEPAEHRARLSATKPTEEQKSKVRVELGRRWRMFAGQPDPQDPSHFTIRYQIDGKEGVIDGRLSDGDRLMFTPRVGRLTSWQSGSEYLWDLGPAPTTTPATRAAKSPAR
jgi:hypothetical protein